MKYLIINADDFGLSSPINKAVKTAFEKGKISDASIMPCGEKFDEAVNFLIGLGRKKTGVHLALTGGFSPLVKEKNKIASLLTKNEKLPLSYRSLFFKRPKLEEVYLEFKAQITKVLNRGVAITHLDSHEHVHMFPKILNLVLALAKEYSVPYVRFPVEDNDIIFKEFCFKDLARHSALDLFCRKAKKTIEKSGIKTNDKFFGHFHAGRINKEVLKIFLDSLTEGINEVAVHIAEPSISFIREYPWYKNSGNELEALLNFDLAKVLKENNVEMISY